MKLVDGELVSTGKYLAVSPRLREEIERGEDPVSRAEAAAEVRRRGHVSLEDAERGVRAAENEGTPGLRDAALIAFMSACGIGLEAVLLDWIQLARSPDGSGTIRAGSREVRIPGDTMRRLEAMCRPAVARAQVHQPDA